jgi:hypothetical protein
MPRAICKQCGESRGWRNKRGCSLHDLPPCPSCGAQDNRRELYEESIWGFSVKDEFLRRSGGATKDAVMFRCHERGAALCSDCHGTGKNMSPSGACFCCDGCGGLGYNLLQAFRLCGKHVLMYRGQPAYTNSRQLRELLVTESPKSG